MVYGYVWLIVFLEQTLFHVNWCFDWAICVEMSICNEIVSFYKEVVIHETREFRQTNLPYLKEKQLTLYPECNGVNPGEKKE